MIHFLFVRNADLSTELKVFLGQRFCVLCFEIYGQISKHNSHCTELLISEIISPLYCLISRIVAEPLLTSFSTFSTPNKR